MQVHDADLTLITDRVMADSYKPVQRRLNGHWQVCVIHRLVYEMPVFSLCCIVINYNHLVTSLAASRQPHFLFLCLQF